MNPSDNPRQRRREPDKRVFFRLFTLLFSLGVCAVLAGGVVVFAFYLQIDRSLPSSEALKNYHPALVSSVYAADGSLIGEFYTERRYLVPLADMPSHLIKSFLAAEDARFYEHGGVDFLGIVRASFRNLQAGEIVQGGSTITQQVVKSLLLSPERTMLRKFKEALLAYRIDRTLSKDEILYLYLNQIYFGAGAYGVEAAARTYFDKHVGDLTLAESAILAGLPKMPSKASPFQHPAMARERQQYVLHRMAEVGFTTSEDARRAMVAPLDFAKPKRWAVKDLDYFTEEVRRQSDARFGHDGLYREGLSIYTTMSPRAQQLAVKAVDQGLHELDKRHRTYRGVHLNVPHDEWPGALKILSRDNGTPASGKTVAGLVTGFDEKSRTCFVDLGGVRGKIPPSGWEWTGVSSRRAARLFRPGDMVRVRLDKPADDGAWIGALDQDPGMEGAFMAMEPDTGRVLCMVGGRNFAKSQFNRCTQAQRQPGSSFKPVIYSAAIDKGYSEASILIDSPMVLDEAGSRPWRPANYDRQFWGPIILRRALVHSRNVVTVKLLDAIGVDYAISYARNLGITSPLTPSLALALGSSGVTLQELLTAYTAFANQGLKSDPYMIERVIDRNGKILEEHKAAPEPVISPQTAYIMTHLLQGVVEEGTGTKAKELGRPAAGKTGTTNELKDAWFIGYTPSTLAGVWVGYDDHNISLGKGETGGRAACPIWLYFMKEWLKDQPVRSFTIPSGVTFARTGDSGGTMLAFSGTGPTHPDVEQKAPSTPPPLPPGTSEGESFFKSDLF